MDNKLLTKSEKLALIESYNSTLILTNRNQTNCLIKNYKPEEVFLLNSSIMIDDGLYKYTKITEKEFVDYLKNAKIINSYIGYKQNADYIKNISGVEIKMNRGKTILSKPYSFILVMKLNYRLQLPEKKGDIVNETDYEFGKVEYYDIHYNKEKSQ